MAAPAPSLPMLTASHSWTRVHYEPLLSISQQRHFYAKGALCIDLKSTVDRAGEAY